MTLPIAIMYAVIGIAAALAVLAGAAIVAIDRAERGR
jgi:uncharacterized membrane protein YuzA (DUF378 family)